jgi:predicted phosphodiesterase
MKVLAMSDLHNEIHPLIPQLVDADVVVLAGDIDEGCKGIRWARVVWADKEIIYTPGNHEYYGGKFNLRLAAMRRSAKKFGVHLLEMDEVVLGGVRFLGCTLWTDFDLFGEESRHEAMRIAAREMPDYKMIDYDNNWRISPENLRKRNSLSANWLRNKLLGEKVSKKTVVVTHHLPSKNSVAPKFAEDLLSASFASDWSLLLGYSDVWVHGHTHESIDYIQAGTRIICNPRGYCWDGQIAQNPEFLLDKIINV